MKINKLTTVRTESVGESVNSDTQINTDFLLTVLDQYAKDHNALLVEEASVKLGRALQ